MFKLTFITTHIIITNHTIITDHIIGVLLAFIPALISFGIFLYSYFFLKKNNLITIFSFLVLSGGIWQISDSLIRLSNNLEMANLIYRNLSFGIIFLTPASIHFSLLFTNTFKKSNSSKILTLLYLPAVAFYLCNLFGVTEGTLQHSNFLGYNYNPKGIVDILMTFWTGVLAIITMIILLRHYLKLDKKNHNMYKASLVLAIGFAIPTLMGVLTQVVFPIILGINEIPITTSFITFFSIAAIYSLRNYRLFNYSPFSATQQIFDSLQEGIMITDSEGLIKYTNKSFYSIYGYTQDDLMNQTISQILVDNDDIIDIPTHLSKIKEGLSSYLELLINHKEGTSSTALINSYPYFNDENKIIGMLSLFLDVSELKEREKQLENSRAKLALSQKIAGVGFLIVDVKTMIVDMSDESKQMLGLDETSDKPLTISNLNEKILHPLDYKEVMDNLNAVITQGKKLNMEHRFIHFKTKKTIWVRSHVELFYDDDDNPLQLIGTIIDITKEKEYEKNMLIAMIEGEEKEKTRIAQELHDGIAQYIAAINMYLNSLKEDFPKKHKEVFESIQKLVLQAINETRSISHNLLPKQIEKGLEAALNSIIEKHDSTNSFEIHLNLQKFNTKKVSQFVKFNFYRITQEFINNAHKYAQAKNVNINIATKKNQLLFLITDDGIGFNLNKNTENGIGIRNMAQRAKAIGGTFNLTSEPNKGTQLKITIIEVSR